MDFVTGLAMPNLGSGPLVSTVWVPSAEVWVEPPVTSSSAMVTVPSGEVMVRRTPSSNSWSTWYVVARPMALFQVTVYPSSASSLDEAWPPPAGSSLESSRPNSS